MADRTYGPRASHVKGPVSIAVEDRAGIVKAPQPTIPHTLTIKAGQTIPSLSRLHFGEDLAMRSQGGGE